MGWHDRLTRGYESHQGTAPRGTPSDTSPCFRNASRITHASTRPRDIATRVRIARPPVVPENFTAGDAASHVT